jgi:hypothetical protein
MKRAPIGFGILVYLLGGAALGHHGSYEYDTTTVVRYEGVIVAHTWRNPVVHEIVQLDDRIVIRTDWMGAERTIYLDGRSHPPIGERFQQGHSIGRWEGGVLVVDTTNFTDRIYAGLASGGRKHLVERFSLTVGGRQLSYSFVLEDPDYLAQPASGTYLWDYRPDLEPSGVECDRELAGRYLREFR